MKTDADALQTFLATCTSQWEQIVDWPLARFAVTGYLGEQLPPDNWITSVRAIVLRAAVGQGAEVLLVQDPNGYHIIPGGRREEGEQLLETVTREVLEETGWQVTVGELLGFMHFQHLTPLPPAIPAAQPAFVQLIYLAWAQRYYAGAREENGYEIDAKFVAIDRLNEYNISKGEHLFLEAALAQIKEGVKHANI